MSAAKCTICKKTAYPLESLTAIEKVYHKQCFKCTTCKQALNLKNFKAFDGNIYCYTHTPKLKDINVSESVAIKAALSAPKKTAAGLGSVQKSAGGLSSSPSKVQEEEPAEVPPEASSEAPPEAPPEE